MSFVSFCLLQVRVVPKKAKRRITQTMLNDSPGTLVFWCQRNSNGSP